MAAREVLVSTKKKKKKYTEELLPEERKVALTGRVDAWHAAALPDATALQPLHFAASLTAGERKFVHALCESRGSELSSKSEGKGQERHVVVYDAPVEAGQVGGVSAAMRAELTARLELWRNEQQQEQALHFDPTLTTAEREFIHQLAGQHGMSSKSEGSEYHGADWHIVVRRSGCSERSGVVVDCGSGHTCIMFYTTSDGGSIRQVHRAWLHHTDGGNLPLTDILPSAKGGAFVETTLTARLDEFIENLKGVLEDNRDVGSIDSLFVGATGGMREKIAQGQIGEAEVAIIRSGFERSFGSLRVVKFDVLTGEQEATWEYAAAQEIWSGAATVMFPDSETCESHVPSIGLFSGGGKSMQLGLFDRAISFPFSTFPAELEERQGAAPDAWLDPIKWDRFANALETKVNAEAAEHGQFDGCFVGTAMNHRAALYTEIAERPITAAAAAKALRGALAQFRSQDGEIYERMMTSKKYPNYPLARITAMHTFRLATVLELMFAPDAMFFFAANGVDRSGAPIHCEWTVGAFAEHSRN